jgi:GxxExxY protein
MTTEPQSHRDRELDALEPITRRIIGAAVEVHRALGPGLPERVYEKALRIEFDLRGIRYTTQVSIAAVFKGHLLGQYRVDLVVEDAVVVEVKSVTALLPVHEGQVLTYLRLTKKRVGLLINFHERAVVEGVRRLAL